MQGGGVLYILTPGHMISLLEPILINLNTKFYPLKTTPTCGSLVKSGSKILVFVRALYSIHYVFFNCHLNVDSGGNFKDIFTT